MNININENRFFLLNFNVQFDDDYQTIIDELKKEEWVPQGLKQYVGQENEAFYSRWLIKDGNIKSLPLKKIINYIQSEKVHESVLDHLYSFEPQFEGLWGMPKEKMYRFAHWHAYYQLDKPGFELKLHTDYRRLIATGMIYLTEKDDPNVATYFYWDKKPENEIRTTTNYGDGWLHVNDGPNFHTGANRSQEDRYTILLGLTIKHPDD